MSDVHPTIPSEILDELPLPYIEVDARGYIVRANRAALELHSDKQGELVGQLAYVFLPSDEKDKAFASFVDLMLKDESPKPVRRAIFDRSGQFHAYQIYRNLIRDETGVPIGMRLLGVDVSESERRLEKEQGARAFLSSILQAMSEAMLVTDSLGFIRFVNPATEALLGWKSNELIGKTIEHAIPILEFSSPYEKQLDFTMSLQGPRKGIARILNRNREELRVEIGTTPIVDQSNGFTTGVISILRLVHDAQ